MCPVCRTPMLIVELDGIEVDHCPACLGTWLDAGELELIAERAGTDAGRLGAALAGGRAADRSRRRCPRCRRRMASVRVAGPAAIEVDRCRRGDGLWLDRGEMRALTAAFAGDGGDAAARFFADLYRSELTGESKGD